MSSGRSTPSSITTTTTSVEVRTPRYCFISPFLLVAFRRGLPCPRTGLISRRGLVAASLLADVAVGLFEQQDGELKLAAPQARAALGLVVLVVERAGQGHVEDRDHLTGEIAKAIERDRPGESPAWSQKLAVTLLSNALRHAVRLRLIAFNPAADIPKAKPRDKEIQFFTAEQSRKLIETSKGRRLHALIALALGTGMRQGELLATRWDAIDFERGTIAVRLSLVEQRGGIWILKEPKSKQSRRTIKLPAFVVAALREHRERMAKESHGSDFVFVTKNGTHISKSNLTRQVWRPALRTAGLPRIRFHDLRHSHASALLNDGASIKAVSRRLGHSSVELTLRVYSHLLPDADDVLADRCHSLLGEGGTTRLAT